MLPFCFSLEPLTSFCSCQNLGLLSFDHFGFQNGQFSAKYSIFIFKCLFGDKTTVRQSGSRIFVATGRGSGLYERNHEETFLTNRNRQRKANRTLLLFSTRLLRGNESIYTHSPSPARITLNYPSTFTSPMQLFPLKRTSVLFRSLEMFDSFGKQTQKRRRLQERDLIGRSLEFGPIHTGRDTNKWSQVPFAYDVVSPVAKHTVVTTGFARPLLLRFSQCVQFLRALGSQSGVSVWQHTLVG